MATIDTGEIISNLIAAVPLTIGAWAGYRQVVKPRFERVEQKVDAAHDEVRTNDGKRQGQRIEEMEQHFVVVVEKVDELHQSVNATFEMLAEHARNASLHYRGTSASLGDVKPLHPRDHEPSGDQDGSDSDSVEAA